MGLEVVMKPADMVRLTRGLPSKSAKIRVLAEAGVPRADIARFLDIRYQHVRNVLTGPVPGLDKRGFEDVETPSFLAAEHAFPILTEDGALTIPAVLTGALGAKPGDRLVVVEDDGGLWIGTQAAGIRRAQAMARRSMPEGTSGTDLLFEMRRRDFEAEQKEGAS